MIASILSILGNGLGLVLGLFKAKNSPDVIRSKEAAQDEATLKQANTDLAKGDPTQLGKDISP